MIASVIVGAFAVKADSITLAFIAELAFAISAFFSWQAFLNRDDYIPEPRKPTTSRAIDTTQQPKKRSAAQQNSKRGRAQRKREKTAPRTQRTLNDPDNLSWSSILNARYDASDDELKRAYRQAARKAHPDAGGSDDEMKIVNAAYKEAQDDIYRILKI